MSPWRLLALGFAVYLLALLATAPATLIDARLDQASAGALRLAQAKGTLWSGTGQIEIRDAGRRSAISKHIDWHVRPAYLLRGRLHYEVALDNALKRFAVTISPSQIEIEDADISLPAAALGLAIPKLAALGLGGDMLLHVPRLAFARGTARGNATLQWNGAGSAFTRVSPLGDYELRLEGDGATVQASLHTLRGPLQLDGHGAWTVGRNPEFEGNARVAPQQMQQLAPLLRMIAVDRGDGRFALQLK